MKLYKVRLIDKGTGKKLVCKRPLSNAEIALLGDGYDIQKVRYVDESAKKQKARKRKEARKKKRAERANEFLREMLGLNTWRPLDE